MNINNVSIFTGTPSRKPHNKMKVIQEALSDTVGKGTPIKPDKSFRGPSSFQTNDFHVMHISNPRKKPAIISWNKCGLPQPKSV